MDWLLAYSGEGQLGFELPNRGFQRRRCRVQGGGRTLARLQRRAKHQDDQRLGGRSCAMPDRSLLTGSFSPTMNVNQAGGDPL